MESDLLTSNSLMRLAGVSKALHGHFKMKVDSEEHIQREEEHWMRWVSSSRELESKRKTTEAHKTFY